MKSFPSQEQVPQQKGGFLTAWQRALLRESLMQTRHSNFTLLIVTALNLKEEMKMQSHKHFLYGFW